MKKVLVFAAIIWASYFGVLGVLVWVVASKVWPWFTAVLRANGVKGL